MRKCLIYLFLITILNPYKGRGIDYAQDEIQVYTYEATYKKLSIEVISPEPSKEDRERDRKIKKIIDSVYYGPLARPPYSGYLQ